MQKAIQLATKISKNLDNDWWPELCEINLHRTFETIYDMKLSNKVTSTLVAAIIFSYDNDSKWIDLKKDGREINQQILEGLYADFEESIYQEFIELKNEEILYAIGSYLDLLPDWRFVTVKKMIDYHAKYVRETEANLGTLDEDKKIKARENIGRLIKEAISQRNAASELILQIEKDYVHTNHRVDQDFDEKYTDSTIKRNIESWRHFIKYEVLPKKTTTL